MKSLKHCKDYQNVTQRNKVSKCSWRNGTHSLGRCRVATKLQFVKNKISAKQYKKKHSKMRYACIFLEGTM